ncbi:MAG TPA: transglutaminase-like domain-containing protein [Anaerolineaceae bacterium]|nr:transglutaminase-like domain-containing protein [Anaerolineaceae bacterium]
MNTNKRWWDLLSVIFLVITEMTVVARLYATQWTTGLERIEYLTFLGIVLGLALGQSKFSPRVVQLLGLAYTIIVVPWQMVSEQTKDALWSDRLASLVGRLTIVTNQFLNHHVVDDSILFITLMAFLFWLLGMTAGYTLTRYGNPWTAILPTGLTLFIINNYDSTLPSSGRFIGTFLFFALLIIGRLTYLRYKTNWQERGIVQSPEAGLDIGKAVIAAVIVLVLLTWTAPAIASSSESARQFWESISHPWDTVRNRFSDAVASLKGSVGLVADFYGDSMQLGTGTHLGNDLVMKIDASSPQPPGSRYYWRARSYDTYSSRDGWHTTITNQKTFSPKDSEIKYPNWVGRETIQFTISSRISQLRTVYTGPAPLWISRPGDLVLDYADDGSADVATILATPPIKAGETYQVRSWVGTPGIVDLQKSGDTYPQWVSDHYLQLPDHFSPRVKELARTITRGTKNPYDAADAITKYLRSNITYQNSVPSAPIGVDPIEYFLFDVKGGFCNYYASAEVLMLRSLGIPARMSVGFAQGQVQQGNDTTFYVRYRDAHAWPEVYFNGYGWVEFEPTVSQPDRQLPAASLAGAGEGANQLPDMYLNAANRGLAREDTNLPEKPTGDRSTTVPSVPVRRLPTTVWLGFGLGCLMLVWGSYNLLRYRFQGTAFPILLNEAIEQRGITAPIWLRLWVSRVSLSPVQKAYNGINRSLRILGKTAPVSATPTERAISLSAVLPSATEPTNILVNEYERDQYSKNPGDNTAAHLAWKKIWNLTIRSLIRRLLHRE